MRSTKIAVLIVTALVSGATGAVRADNEVHALRGEPLQPMQDAPCTLARDASLQSHFLLLKLCWLEERQTREPHDEETSLPREISPLPHPGT